MMDETELRQWLARKREDREGWEEPGGHLIPTEPDIDARARVRMRLDMQIYTLMMVLGFPRAVCEAQGRKADW